MDKITTTLDKIMTGKESKQYLAAFNRGLEASRDEFCPYSVKQPLLAQAWSNGWQIARAKEVFFRSCFALAEPEKPKPK